ncbi:5'/3'-nucleotidase SurE [Kwoniella heveanensis CBS 569]|uniref:5'/3'-nucleotidase SurE n=1 Tax=Kwoniella heveanensis BCC8398 TaxID=1296120 RepID=A0A1B9H0E3_9TREE|nr:5'/3'-nucleotidase SurE [Kwoniella heveanensis BCC8398]OCF43130.1 5'/3'-nucleotidase SurE [Kwoniella heveanensis CBS 569]
MPRLQTYKERPVVLLTNDDGPPCASSPNIFAFCKLLQSRLGWDVRVVIPDCQKSWVGKAYAISDVITASYFYPLEPDGLKGEITTTPRPLKEGETMEWVLLSSTPASCTNIALHNLYPGEIDLVISGPNHGRNSSTAFALSSGTLGAALAGALSVPVPGPSSPSSSSSAVSLHEDHMPCIAVSYGVVTRPVSDKTQDLATEAAVEVCAKLFNDWGYDHDHVLGRHLVQIYSVNIPLVEDALVRAERKTCWTNMWRNTYGGLFKATKL